MSQNIKLLADRFDSVRMKISAVKILEAFIASGPNEADTELAYLLFASWCHEHGHHARRSAS
jgi:hypothetical protein